MLKNNSKYDIQVGYIEPEGYYSGARWVIDPYGFVTPFQVIPGDSIVLTVKIDFPVEYSFSGFECDTMDILTDYKDYGIPVYVNEELMTGISQDENPPGVGDFSVHPNPFTNSTTLFHTLEEPENVQFTVYNVQSKIVWRMQEMQDEGEHKIKWNAEGLPAGMYYFRMQAGDIIAGGKIVKMK